MNNRSESTQLSLIILILLIALGALIDHYLAPAGLVVALPEIRVPWLAVWFVLALLIAFAPPLVTWRWPSRRRHLPRFPEVYEAYDTHTPYHTQVYTGETQRLEGYDR